MNSDQFLNLRHHRPSASLQFTVKRIGRGHFENFKTLLEDQDEYEFKKSRAFHIYTIYRYQIYKKRFWPYIHFKAFSLD